MTTSLEGHRMGMEQVLMEYKEDKLRFEFVYVTPEMAQSFLDRSPSNRSIRPRWVTFLADQIKQDLWKPYTGDVFRFNDQDEFRDGHHRALAIIEADQAVWGYVVVGITDDLTIDTGMKRTSGDVLRWRGEKDPNSLAATVRIIDLLRRYPGYSMFRRGNTVSNATTVAIVDQEPGIRDSVAFATTVSREIPVLTNSQIAALHYLLVDKHGEEDASVFFESLAKGALLAVDSPILVLRNQLMNEAAQRTKRRREDILGWTIMAWNKWIQDSPTSLLRLSKTYPSIV